MLLLSAPPPSRYYWRTQVLAWTLYGVFNLVMFRAFVPTAAGTPLWVFGATSFVIAATALGASHVLRQLIWRGEWLARAPLALLMRLLLANAVLAVGSVVVIGLVSGLVLPAQAAGRGPQGWSAQIEARLDPKVFFRANRQQIINLHFVAGVEPWFSHSLRLTLRGGAEVVEVSRQQSVRFRELLSL